MLVLSGNFLQTLLVLMFADVCLLTDHTTIPRSPSTITPDTVVGSNRKRADGNVPACDTVCQHVLHTDHRNGAGVALGCPLPRS